MGPLEASYVKLDRARSHAQDLKDRLDAALVPDPDCFLRNTEGDPPRHVYRIRRLPAIDLEWSAILGDFLTNMRASLDYLAHDLVRLDGGVANLRTDFPIMEPPSTKRSQAQLAHITGVSSRRILEVVESVQPHEGLMFGGGPLAHPLYLLKKLSNTDKHRLLLFFVIAIDPKRMHLAIGDGAETPQFAISMAPLNVGDPVAWVDQIGGALKPKFDPHLAFDVRLDPSTGLLGEASVLDVMAMIHHWVESIVIGCQFAPLLHVQPRFSGNLYR